MGRPNKYQKTRTGAAGSKRPAGHRTPSAMAIKRVPRWACGHVLQAGNWCAIMLMGMLCSDPDPKRARGCCSMTVVGEEDSYAVMWPEHVLHLVAICQEMMDSSSTRPRVLRLVHIAAPLHTLARLVTMIPAEVEIEIGGPLGCIAIKGTPEAGVGIDSDRIVPIDMALIAELRALDLSTSPPVAGASE